MSHVYFDHNATTPLDERVLAAMLPFLRQHHGNASSRHQPGAIARRAVEHARAQVAALIGAEPAQVVFTSGGTEANNLFVKGMAGYLKPGQIAVSAIEHPSVAKPAEALARGGWRVRKLAVDRAGRVEPDDIGAALGTHTDIVSVMLANNETGVLQDVAAIAEKARAAGAIVHTDAVQALGKVAVDFDALGVHAMTLSAHKICGPKGAGALVHDKRISLRPLLSGGGHEQGLRSGTENVPAIVGFGAACEIAGGHLREAAPHLAELRNALEQGLGGLGAAIFGATAPRIPNTSYFAFPDVDGETLVVELDKAGYAVASGAACSSVSTEPSATLLAMGVAPELARGALRVSLGRGNTHEQIDAFLRTLNDVLLKLRRLAAIAV
ncbi:MAG TPA: cysteine desulfurase family protein [Burkholderiales bacterium]|nr:cysteine desulfurase family protein [Burkholderiales bacterium]